MLGAVAAPVVRAADGDDPLLYVLQALAEDAGTSLVVGDTGVVSEADPVGDAGTDRGYDDITSASIASIPVIPAWLLERLRLRGAPTSLCGARGQHDSRSVAGRSSWASGWPGRRPCSPGGSVASGARCSHGRVPDGAARARRPFAGASQVVITRVQDDERQVLSFAFVDDKFTSVPDRRPVDVVGDDLLTLIPVDEELLTPPVGWDAYASSSDEAATGRDTIRGLDGVPAARLDRAVGGGDIRGGGGVAAGPSALRAPRASDRSAIVVDPAVLAAIASPAPASPVPSASGPALATGCRRALRRRGDRSGGGHRETCGTTCCSGSCWA